MREALRRLRGGRSRGFGRLLSRTLVIRLAGAGLATGGLALVGVGTVAAPVVSNSVALAAQGNQNRTDVWVDNVGNPPGPGHEQDPHLACTNINLWGVNMKDSSGTYTIDGWPPSGSLQADLVYGPATWNYDTGAGGNQVLDVINVSTLIANATANGDKAVNSQGLHFKLQFLQAPQKHKTFWVTCEPPTTTTTTTTTTTSTTTSSSSSTTTTAAGSTTTTTAPPGTVTTTAAAGVLGASTTTPATGADVAFGLGLGLVIAGGAAALGAGRLGGRRKH